MSRSRGQDAGEEPPSLSSEEILAWIDRQRVQESPRAAPESVERVLLAYVEERRIARMAEGRFFEDLESAALDLLERIARREGLQIKRTRGRVATCRESQILDDYRILELYDRLKSEGDLTRERAIERTARNRLEGPESWSGERGEARAIGKRRVRDALRRRSEKQRRAGKTAK